MGCTKSQNSETADPKKRGNFEQKGTGQVFQEQDKATDVKGVAVNTATFVHFIEEPVGNHYETRRKLGDGSFGIVSEVKHKASGDIRAMKKITKKYLEKNEQAKSEFNSEIQILRYLSHPNIIKMYEFFEDARYISLITELCTGGELFDYIVAN